METKDFWEHFEKLRELYAEKVGMPEVLAKENVDGFLSSLDLLASGWYNGKTSKTSKWE